MSEKDNLSQAQFDLIINELHKFPRFGHSSSIAKLASFDRLEVEDYIRGLFSFCTLLLIVWFGWSIFLLIMKFIFHEYVGVFAGGKVVDVAHWRKMKIPRHIRRKRIIRNWRIQAVFLVASITIPIGTVLLVRNGLSPFLTSLDNIQAINDDLETIAFRGSYIASSLMEKREELYSNFTQQEFFNLSSFCIQDLQNSNASSSLTRTNNSSKISLAVVQQQQIATFFQYIDAGLDDLDIFLQENVYHSRYGLELVIQSTQNIDKSIDYCHSNDYLLKLFLLAINVVNGFFLFGTSPPKKWKGLCYVLFVHNIQHS